MTRRAIVVLVGAWALCGGCRRADPSWKAEPTLLIPPSATLLAGAKIRATLESSAYATQRPQLESGAVADALAVATACKLHPTLVDTVHLGADTSGNFALVVQGLGIGEVERWECLASRQAPGTILPGFRVDRTDSARPRLLGSSSQAASAVLIDASTLVVVSQGWGDALNRLIADPPPLEQAPLLADRQRVLGGGTSSHDMWFYAKSPELAQPNATPTIAWVAGAIGIAGGVKANVSASFADHAAAILAEGQVRERLRLFSRMKPMFGLSRDLAANFNLSVENEVLSVQGELSAADLSDVQRALSQMSEPHDAPPLPPPSLGLSSDTGVAAGDASQGTADPAGLPARAAEL